MDAVFKDTPQALHVSFLILSRPVLGDALFRRFLIQLIEQLPKGQQTPERQNTLKALRGERDPDSTVNFDGLTQLEVRGQCAMVCAAVNDRLPDPERGVILARFGNPPDKRLGIVLLAEYAAAALDEKDLDALTYLVARRYLTASERRATDADFSFRALAERFDISKSSLHRAAAWLKPHFEALEARAIDLLDGPFKAHGLVEDEIRAPSPVESPA